MFTIALIVTGVSAAAYAVGAIGEPSSAADSATPSGGNAQRDIDRLASHHRYGYGRLAARWWTSSPPA